MLVYADTNHNEYQRVPRAQLAVLCRHVPFSKDHTVLHDAAQSASSLQLFSKQATTSQNRGPQYKNYYK